MKTEINKKRPGIAHFLRKRIKTISGFRSDFLWRSKLNSEQEGVDTMRGINKILLENILPAHVAEHYLLRAQGVAGVLRDTNVSDAIIRWALVRWTPSSVTRC